MPTAAADAHLVQLAECAAGVAQRVPDLHTRQAMGFMLELVVGLMRRPPAVDTAERQSPCSSLAVSWLTDSCSNSFQLIEDVCPPEAPPLPSGGGAAGRAMRAAASRASRVPVPTVVAWSSAGPTSEVAAHAPVAAPPTPIAVTPPPRRCDATRMRRLIAAQKSRGNSQSTPMPGARHRSGGACTVSELPTHQEEERKWSDSLADETPPRLPARHARAQRGLRLGAATVGELPSADPSRKSGQQPRGSHTPRTRLGFGNVSQEAKEDTLRKLRRLAETDNGDTRHERLSIN